MGFWKIIGVTIGVSIIANVAIDTASKWRRTKLQDEEYKNRIEEKRQAKAAKKAAKKVD